MSQFNLRKQLINSTMDSLKIDKNPFNYSTIENYIEHIPDTKLKEFYSNLFGSQHSFLNGMDRIATVADGFKEAEYDGVDTYDIGGKIDKIKAYNAAVFDNATKSGRTFDDELKGTKFISMSEDEEAYYNLVKPYCNYKSLIGNINCYSDSSSQFISFKKAWLLHISHKEESVALANPIQNLQINRMAGA